MRKISKMLMILPVLALVFSFNFNVVGASELKNDNETNIKLNILSVTVPYNTSDYDFVREEDSKEVKVKIIEKETGALKEVLGELKSVDSFSTQGLVRPQSAGYKDVITYSEHVIGENYPNLTIRNRLYLSVNVYFSDSFAQINSINDKWWSAVSTGAYTITDAHAYASSFTGKFPTYSVRVTGSCVLQTPLSKIGGISVKDLGFDLDSSQSYFRKPISLSYEYNVGR